MSSNDSLDALGRKQWGLATRSQLVGVMSVGQLRRRQADGLLQPVHRGVYRLAGAPNSWRQQAMAAVLAFGPPCAISHRAAARLWELQGFDAKMPEVTVPADRHGRRDGILSHRSALPDSEVSQRYGIPVTTVARTIVDLAGVCSPYLLGRAMDEAHRRHLAKPDQIAELLDRRGGWGRSGTWVLRDLLQFRLEYQGVGDSEWADQVFRWIVGGGLEAPMRQVPVAVNGGICIIDMAYPDRMIAIEFDGFDFHGRRHRFDADARRYTELGLAGWLIVKVTARSTAAEVVDQVRRALALRPSGLPGVAPRR